jgi:hypothetical protein
MTNVLKRTLHLSILALVATIATGPVGAFAASPTPASGWISAMPCPRAARTTPVIDWIRTPGPVGTPIIQDTGKAVSGAWRPATVALKDLPTGPAADAKTKAAVEHVVVDVSQCAAFPDNGVDAYFSDDFFRRTAVVQPSSGTPGAGGFSWGFAGLAEPGTSPSVTKAWELPNGKIGAIVQTASDRAPLFIVFVQAPQTGDWQIDEMAYLSDGESTPTP